MRHLVRFRGQMENFSKSLEQNWRVHLQSKEVAEINATQLIAVLAASLKMAVGIRIYRNRLQPKASRTQSGQILDLININTCKKKKVLQSASVCCCFWFFSTTCYGKKYSVSQFILVGDVKRFFSFFIDLTQRTLWRIARRFRAKNVSRAKQSPSSYYGMDRGTLQCTFFFLYYVITVIFCTIFRFFSSCCLLCVHVCRGKS